MYQENIYKPRLLLGSKFTLIRPEIYKNLAQFDTRSFDDVLISVGGTDNTKIGRNLETYLCTHTDLSLRTTEGFGSKTNSDPNVTAEFMSNCAVGVIGCGTTLWEAAFLGLPTIGLIVADNQLQMAKTAESHGFSKIFDCREIQPIEEITQEIKLLLNNIELRRKMSQKGSIIFDGIGSERVAFEIFKLIP